MSVYTLVDSQISVFEVNILPGKSQKFTTPQPCVYCHQNRKIELRWTGRILIDKANASELASMGAEEHLDSKQRILLSLRDRDRSTAEVLSDDTGISIKTVKNNLTQLKRAGLAYEVGKDGHATVYAPL